MAAGFRDFLRMAMGWLSARSAVHVVAPPHRLAKVPPAGRTGILVAEAHADRAAVKVPVGD